MQFVLHFYIELALIVLRLLFIVAQILPETYVCDK